jgi:hypothetical protein
MWRLPRTFDSAKIRERCVRRAALVTISSEKRVNKSNTVNEACRRSHRSRAIQSLNGSAKAMAKQKISGSWGWYENRSPRVVAFICPDRGLPFEFLFWHDKSVIENGCLFSSLILCLSFSRPAGVQLTSRRSLIYSLFPDSLFPDDFLSPI